MEEVAEEWQKSGVVSSSPVDPAEVAQLLPSAQKKIPHNTHSDMHEHTPHLIAKKKRINDIPFKHNQPESIAFGFCRTPDVSACVSL